MKLFSADVDYSSGYDTDNYVVMAKDKEEALEKIKLLVGKTAWRTIEKQIVKSIGEEIDGIVTINQSWD